MEKKFCRYTKSQFESLGYSTEFNDFPVKSTPIEVIKQQDTSVKSGFDNIIDLIYSSTDGSIDNTLNLSISENAPDDVKRFISNVLNQPIASLASAPDDDLAFETLIPRGMDRSQAQIYINRIRNFVISNNQTKTTE